MKTEDLVTLGLVGVIAYIAYQKYGKDSNADFGLKNPNDPNWGDSSSTSTSSGIVQQGLVDQLISQATEFTL